MVFNKLIRVRDDSSENALAPPPATPLYDISFYGSPHGESLVSIMVTVPLACSDMELQCGPHHAKWPPLHNLQLVCVCQQFLQIPT